MQGCYLLISDIHADIGALEAILRLSGDDAFTERYGRVTRVLNLGDVVERGYNPCEVIDRLKGMDNLVSVIGNHDEAFVWSAAVSGSDARSVAAHVLCRRRGSWERFFMGLPTVHIDRAERLYVVHGGPLDPGPLCNDMAGEALSWLSSRTWQRLSRMGGYFDMNGYHYTPEQAFDAVRDVLEPGFAIICGHEHAEAAVAEHSGRTEDILFGLDTVAFAAGGRRVEEKRIVLRDDTNYLVRLGLAGPAGYYERYGWDRCYFGVYHQKDGERCISLLSFSLGRDAVPP
jgi:Calcineurin-like phosphoesterase